MNLVGLCDRADKLLTDVVDGIKLGINDSEVRARILRNLESIQDAVCELPRDLVRISKNEPIKDYQYERPHG